MGKQISLGDVRRRLQQRYEKDRLKVKNYSPSELVVDAIEKKVIGFLTELGIDYPVDFNQPPPDVEVAFRQGTKCLEPQGSTDGGSPPTSTDQSCLTFKARSKGFLVIDYLDIIAEDPIAEEFSIRYTFDGEQVNSINYQITQSDSEPGHWKFGRIVLVDGGTLQICAINGNAYAGGCFSFEGRLWRL